MISPCLPNVSEHVGCFRRRDHIPPGRHDSVVFTSCDKLLSRQSIDCQSYQRFRRPINPWRSRERRKLSSYSFAFLAMANCTLFKIDSSTIGDRIRRVSLTLWARGAGRKQKQSAKHEQHKGNCFHSSITWQTKSASDRALSFPTGSAGRSHKERSIFLEHR